MAHLWHRLDGKDWQVVPLNGAPIRVPGEESVWLVPVAEADGAWALVASSARPLRVNGVRASAGLRVLSDRDEIMIAEKDSLFFSTERRARVEPAPLVESALTCPRCKSAIDAHTLAVKCPSCSVWHHEAETMSCWRYAETCALCDQPTALDAGYRFTPEEL